MTPAEFWTLTPIECFMFVLAAEARRRDRQKDAKVAAWLSAYCVRAKRLPKLKPFVDPPKTRILTPEQAVRHRADMEAAVADMLPAAKVNNG